MIKISFDCYHMRDLLYLKTSIIMKIEAYSKIVGMDCFSIFIQLA